MTKRKRIQFGMLATAAIIALPVAVAVSCGSNEDENANLKKPSDSKTTKAGSKTPGAGSKTPGAGAKKIKWDEDAAIDWGTLKKSDFNKFAPLEKEVMDKIIGTHTKAFRDFNINKAKGTPPKSIHAKSIIITINPPQGSGFKQQTFKFQTDFTSDQSKTEMDKVASFIVKVRNWLK